MFIIRHTLHIVVSIGTRSQILCKDTVFGMGKEGIYLANVESCSKMSIFVEKEGG